MRTLMPPKSMQFIVAGAWDLDYRFRLLLKLNIGVAGNLTTNRWYSNNGFRLTTQTF